MHGGIGMKCDETWLTTLHCVPLELYINKYPVYYYFLSPSQMVTSSPPFPLLPVVFARLPQIYELPTLPHIQSKYIVCNVVRGVTERKAEIRITPD